MTKYSLFVMHIRRILDLCLACFILLWRRTILRTFENFAQFDKTQKNKKTQNNNITHMSLHVLEDGAQSPSYRLLLPNLPLQVQVLKHNKQGAI